MGLTPVPFGGYKGESNIGCGIGRGSVVMSTSLVPENHIRSYDYVSYPHEDSETPRKRKAGSTRSDKLSILHDDDHAACDYKNRKIILKLCKSSSIRSDGEVSGKILAAACNRYDENASEEICSAERLSTLPDEIVLEIFDRLPVKSLVTLSCVSKYWNSIISNKQFVKTHLEMSTRNPKLSHHSLISISSWHYRWDQLQGRWDRVGTNVPKQRSLQSLLYDQDSYASDIHFPTVDPSKKEDFRVVGSCNGLCCIVVDEAYNIVLVNPSTTQYKILPDIDCFPEQSQFRPQNFGFGVSDDGDYKLLCIGVRLELIGKEPSGSGAIYTLRTNSWRKVHNMKCFPSQSGGLFMNGKIHWLVKDSYSSHSIVSFNLGTETNGLVYLPDNVRDGFTPSSLGELGGSLSLILDYPEISKDIWVLKEYGINKSWIKAFTVPNAGHPWSNSIRHRDCFKPLCISVEGELLFVYESTFAIYNPKNQSFRSVPSTNFSEDYKILNYGAETDPQVTVYIESLVSPFPDAHLDA